MLIYAVRHGESVANVEQFYSGQSDVPLTEKGKEDALSAKRTLEGISFDKVYSSDLQRALHTCKIALPGIEPITTPLLREIDVGNLVGRKWAVCRAEGGDAFKESLDRSAFKEFGGESREDHTERVGKFMKSLETLDAERVAVFCHNGTLHRMCTWIGDTGGTEGRLFRNCETCVFEFLDGVWSFKGTLYEEDKDVQVAGAELNEEK